MPFIMDIQLVPQGFHVFVNGDEIKLFKDVVVGTVFPTISKLSYFVAETHQVRALRWTSVEDKGFATEYGYVPQSIMKPSLYLTMNHLRTNDKGRVDKEEDLIYQIFEKQNNYGFIPFQIKQVSEHQGNGMKVMEVKLASLCKA